MIHPSSIKTVHILKKEILEVVDTFIKGTNNLVIGRQLHSVDGFFKSRINKIDIWFIHFKESNQIVIRSFIIFGHKVKFENIDLPNGHGMESGELFKNLFTEIKNEVNGITS